MTNKVTHSIIRKLVDVTKAICIATVAITMAACSSSEAPPNKQLYLLDTVPTDITASHNQRVEVRVSSLPTYLNQRALVMMRDAHQMEIANNHAWADRLSDSIERVVRYEYAKALTLVDKADYCVEQCVISLNIEHFYPSFDGEVFLVGYYELSVSDAAMVKRSFNLKGEIQSDGYLGAVKEMRALLANLSTKIAEQG